MRYRQLGDAGITVSEVGFGIWTVATNWWGEHTDEEAIAMMRRAFDLGLTFFDAADTYGNGHGEELLGQAFAGRRQEIVIATKFGYDFYSHAGPRDGQRELPQDFSPAFVRRALEGSLRRLNTDYIDLYQLHNPRLTALESDELFALLDALKAEGKIRAYGAALGPAIGWLDEGTYAMRRRKIGSVQMIYNLLEQHPGQELIEVAQETDV